MIGNRGNGVGGSAGKGAPKGAKAATKPAGAKGKMLQAPGAGHMTGSGKGKSKGMKY